MYRLSSVYLQIYYCTTEKSNYPTSRKEPFNSDIHFETGGNKQTSLLKHTIFNSHISRERELSR